MLNECKQTMWQIIRKFKFLLTLIGVIDLNNNSETFRKKQDSASNGTLKDREKTISNPCFLHCKYS